jgi:hypothetical protein
MGADSPPLQTNLQPCKLAEFRVVVACLGATFSNMNK